VVGRNGCTAGELAQNPQLARMATVPLFLQMLMSVFRAGSPYRPLANVAEQEQIHELIASYVELRLASEVPQAARERFTIPQVRRLVILVELRRVGAQDGDGEGLASLVGGEGQRAAGGGVAGCPSPLAS
jgi:hypothetical protein